MRRGFEKYQHAVLEMMTSSLKPLMENPQEIEAGGAALWNHIFDLPGPREVPAKRSPRILYRGMVFVGFSEISTSIETLRDIKSLIGRPPERRPRISEDRYLQILAEAYFNEVYLLRERLRKYAVSIRRAFAHDSQFNNVAPVTLALTKTMERNLEPIVKIRNSHIHIHRFRDEGISRLGTIKLLLLSRDEKTVHFMRNHYRVEQAKVKKQWRKAINTFNDHIRTVIDEFFENLYPLVFQKDNPALVFPTKVDS